MTRNELEHIIRASADITGQYEFITIDLAVLQTEVSQIKWMLGLVIGGIIAILAKLLGH